MAGTRLWGGLIPGSLLKLRTHRQDLKFKSRVQRGVETLKANCQDAASFASRHFLFADTPVVIVSLCRFTVVGRRWLRKIFNRINPMVIFPRH